MKVNTCILQVLIPFAAVAASAAELKVVTEYIYPSTYTVTPITRVGQNGQVTIVGGIVEPGNFQMREVGAILAVDATVARLDVAGNVAAAIADEKSKSNTSLMIAAATGDEVSVKKLLAGHAIVNVQNKAGSTALLGAAAGGHTSIVKMLLDAGANINLKTKNGSTALMFAARNGHNEIINLLLANGASVTTTDNDGITALMYAIYGGNSDTVKLLVAKGAKIDASDRKGTKPLDLAKNQKKDEIVTMLAKAFTSK